ncbi:hypothetical protein BCR44DRAFT_1023712 [Catenaria anguillulae PL171]|uniref:Uncharacterized protein n=1 Tax=Catenaria anguillulae PL171 TaxID=765915 RepID=A0A1Y2HSV4_9FUNG|nr:hypothetical protein BCR44DRAFT_1023712 [Catenaria anguillulae PL171]
MEKTDDGAQSVGYLAVLLLMVGRVRARSIPWLCVGLFGDSTSSADADAQPEAACDTQCEAGMARVTADSNKDTQPAEWTSGTDDSLTIDSSVQDTCSNHASILSRVAAAAGIPSSSHSQLEPITSAAQVVDIAVAPNVDSTRAVTPLATFPPSSAWVDHCWPSAHHAVLAASVPPSWSLTIGQ